MFLEVDNAEAAFGELKSNGLTTHPSWTARKPPEEREVAGFRIDRHDPLLFKVFFVVAPDGLCYCLGERHKVRIIADACREGAGPTKAGPQISLSTQV